MIRWTPSARAELERYCSRLKPALETSGADSIEVAEDLKRHIDEEIAAARLQSVTGQDVRRILMRMGEPDLGPPLVSDDRAVLNGNASHPAPRRPPLRISLLLFGVLLPAATLGIELLTHMCAGAFFDPIPTWWQALMVGFVPVMNLAVWRAIRLKDSSRRQALGWLNAAAIGVSLFYTLLFLPMMPAAVFAIMFFGWGLLPLSPLFALVAAARLRIHLRRLETIPAVASPLPGFWRGVGIGLGTMILLQLPVSLTQIGLHWAASDDPGETARGMRWLRAVGDEEMLLRACYGRTRWAHNLDLVTFAFTQGGPVSAEQARDIYYRVTGHAFNTVAPPQIYTARGRWNLLEEEFTWDTDQGGASVAGRVKGLSLLASRQDGLIDADAALAYTEWTLEFRNISTMQREARAQILLPSGGVVSRLTLWINGEEREAAFGGRSQVREAYEQVVARRRDPVLVTTSGPDRVLMQCFPVPPGGTMKVRLGVTSPLVLLDDKEAVFRWPHFLERNFTIPVDFKHVLWAESGRWLEARGDRLRSDRSASGLSAIRGEADEAALGAPPTTVHIRRDGAAAGAWTVDTRDASRRVIQQRIEARLTAPPRRVVLVVDASRDMKEFLPEIAEAIEHLPDGMEFGLVLASDLERAPAAEITRLTRGKIRQTAEDLRTTRVVGGQDNVPALVRAWDLAAQSPPGVIIWVHGVQPVESPALASLRQRLERRPGSVGLFEIQTVPGPNRITENLDGLSAVRSVPRLGEFKEDLKRLLETRGAKEPAPVLVRERLDSPVAGAVLQGKETSLHLARLWAFDEIRRLIASQNPAAALELAGRYQLVTPVSGAVVLETQEQYKAAGLNPVDATTVPSVPEPSTWALLGLGGLLLLLRGRVRRFWLHARSKAQSAQGGPSNPG